MLITESQLVRSVDPMTALSEATYLSESESVMQPITVPVREMSRFGEGYTMVRFDDVARLAEDHGVSYIDAMAAIAEASQVDASKMTVAVDEADIICDPSIVECLANVVVAPVSESSLAYQYVAECVDAWAALDESEEADMALVNALVEDTELDTFLEGVGDTIKNAAGKVKDFYTKDFKKAKQHYAGMNDHIKGMQQAEDQDTYDRHFEAGTKDTEEAAKAAAKGIGKVGGTLGAVVVGGIALNKLVGAAKDKPKSWIGQKIAALRGIYKKWMERAQKADNSTAGKIKAVAGKILAVIDQLMAKMQKAAG